MNEIYIIVHPGSDKGRLSIVALENNTPSELEEYDRASRHIFHDAQEVLEYAQNLASKHNLPLYSRDEKIQDLLDKDNDGFLD